MTLSNLENYRLGKKCTTNGCIAGLLHPGNVCFKRDQLLEAVKNGQLKQVHKLKLFRELCDKEGLPHEAIPPAKTKKVVPEAPERPVSLQPCYEVLGLAPGVPLADVKRTFTRLAFATHPDKGGDPEAFCKVHEAYLKITKGGVEDAGDRVMEYVEVLQHTFGHCIPFANECDNREWFATYVGMMQLLQGDSSGLEVLGWGAEWGHPQNYKWLLRAARDLANARFGPVEERRCGLDVAATARDLEILQPDLFKSGGPITIFFQFDPDAADDEKRQGSPVWQALTFALGVPEDTTLLDPYCNAFNEVSHRERNAPMHGQMEPRYTGRGARAKYAREMKTIEQSTPIWFPDDTRGRKRTFEEAMAAFHGIRTREAGSSSE